MSCGGCAQALNTASIHTTTTFRNPPSPFYRSTVFPSLRTFPLGGLLAFMLTLKPNTYYKTRDGRKAFVGCLNPNNAFPTAGYIVGDSAWQTWRIDGSIRSSESPNNFDLVSEWTEPKLRTWKPEEVPLGAWMREKTVGLPSLIVAITSNSLWRGHGDQMALDYALAHYEHSTDGGKTWLPCGVAE